MQRICALPRPGPAGGSWSGDGSVVFAAGGFAPRIYVVPAAGGEARPLTTPDASRGEGGHYWPQFLPDGRRFLFVVQATQDNVGLYLASLDRPDERRLVRPGMARAQYASGRLLFVRDGALLAQSFDASRAELSGEPAVIAESPATYAGISVWSWGWFSASPSGTLAYLAARAARGFERTWLDRKGAELGTVGKPARYGQLALAPDERRVAVELIEEGTSDIWTIDLTRGVASRLTSDPAAEYNPVWSPDGQEVAFTSAGEDLEVRMYHKALQGDSPALPFREDLDRVFPECWSSRAKGLIYTTFPTPDGQTFGMVPSDPDADLQTVLEKAFPIDEAQVSPDGRWLAYDSQESGQWEVYLEPFRAGGERVRVSTEGGGQPEWRGDGRELYYVSPDGRLMAVDVRATDGHVEVGLPVGLFSGVIFDPRRDDYAVTADGSGFWSGCRSGGPSVRASTS